MITPGCRPRGPLGVALCGGGARALAQLGVLQVLERESVPVSYVTGTSAGAVVGAVYVTSRSATEATERVLSHLATTGPGFNVDTFARFAGQDEARHGVLATVRSLWRATRPGGALVGGTTARQSLARLLGHATFADARVPFATTALDLTTGRRMIFAEGPLTDAVYASSAIPGLFEPFPLGRRVFVDGGWAEPVPVDACHHLGATHVVAVDVPGRDRWAATGHAVSTALRADELARGLLEETGLRQADFVVRVRADVRHFADFSDPVGLVAAGERAAETVLDRIREVVERHNALFVRVLQPADDPSPEAAL